MSESADSRSLSQTMADEPSSVRVALEGESVTRTIHSESVDTGEDDSSSDWQTVNADISDFAGEEVTVTFETENDAELHVDYAGVLADSTGSGFPDEVEKLDLRMPAGDSEGHNTPLDLNPALADTSGDGLLDSEVVDLEWEYAERGNGRWDLTADVTDATAHPARYDTAENGFSDYEELEV